MEYEESPEIGTAQQQPVYQNQTAPPPPVYQNQAVAAAPMYQAPMMYPNQMVAAPYGFHHPPPSSSSINISVPAIVAVLLIILVVGYIVMMQLGDRKAKEYRTSRNNLRHQGEFAITRGKAFTDRLRKDRVTRVKEQH